MSSWLASKNPFSTLGTVQIHRADLEREEVDRPIEEEKAGQDGENFVDDIDCAVSEAGRDAEDEEGDEK